MLWRPTDTGQRLDDRIIGVLDRWNGVTLLKPTSKVNIRTAPRAEGPWASLALFRRWSRRLAASRTGKARTICLAGIFRLA